MATRRLEILMKRELKIEASRLKQLERLKEIIEINFEESVEVWPLIVVQPMASD